MTADSILNFWFQEIDPAMWWKKDVEFDQTIRDRFSTVHQQATQGELQSWRVSSHGRLAEVIVLDQFSRNLFRDLPLSFAYDGMALVLAQEAIQLGADQELSSTEKAFLYLPFMHSESLSIHQQAVDLFKQPGLENNYDFELKHKRIIDRFGRYPHRNKILGRTSSEEELSFLQEPGSSF